MPWSYAEMFRRAHAFQFRSQTFFRECQLGFIRSLNVGKHLSAGVFADSLVIHLEHGPIILRGCLLISGNALFERAQVKLHDTLEVWNNHPNRTAWTQNALTTLEKLQTIGL